MRLWTRRSLLASFAASGFSVERGKGASFGAELQRFADPATELKKATAEFQPVLDKSEKG